MYLTRYTRNVTNYLYRNWEPLPLLQLPLLPLPLLPLHSSDQPPSIQIGIGTVLADSSICDIKLDVISNHVVNGVKNQNMCPIRFSDSSPVSIAKSEIDNCNGLIVIPGCDKTLSAVAITLFRLNKPGLVICGGDKSNKDPLLQTNRDDCINNSGMNSVNTMATILEVMGLTLPNSSSNPSISQDKTKECFQSVIYLKELISNDLKPLELMTREHFLNGIKMLYLCGGSINGVIHLLDMAKTAGIQLSLQDFKDYENLPILLNMKPYGEYMMWDLYEKGGMMLFIKYLINERLINGDVLTVTGRTLSENVKDLSCTELNLYLLPTVIYPQYSPVKSNSHIKILDGNMAPEGCILKTGNDDNITGSLLVFNSEQEMLDALLNGEIKLSNIILIRYQGEIMDCIDLVSSIRALVGYFGEELPPLLTDGKFTGMYNGMLICNLPDAYNKNSITRILESGDEVIINIKKNTINTSLTSSEETMRFSKHF